MPRCIVILWLLLAVPAAANMANPYRPASTSSSIRRKPPGPPSDARSAESEASRPEARVLSEDLVFHWMKRRGVRVEARYRIEVKGAARGPVAVSFFVPAVAQEGLPPSVQVGSKAPKVTTRPATLDDIGAASMPPEVKRHITEGRTQVLSFEAHFQDGVQQVVVEYDAAVGADVQSIYPITSTAHPMVVYELWPLRSWPLAKTFVLDVTIQLEREATFWENVFGLPEVRCAQVGRLAATAGKGRIVYRAKFGSDFPERLHCVLDADAFD